MNIIYEVICACNHLIYWYYITMYHRLYNIILGFGNRLGARNLVSPEGCFTLPRTSSVSWQALRRLRWIPPAQVGHPKTRGSPTTSSRLSHPTSGKLHQTCMPKLRPAVISRDAGAARWWFWQLLLLSPIDKTYWILLFGPVHACTIPLNPQTETKTDILPSWNTYRIITWPLLHYRILNQP